MSQHNTEAKTKRCDEKLIQLVCDSTPGLSFYYVGNFDKWGDNRTLFVRHEPTGDVLWSCRAAEYNRQAASRLSGLLKAYRMGARLPGKICLSNGNYMGKLSDTPAT